MIRISEMEERERQEKLEEARMQAEQEELMRQHQEEKKQKIKKEMPTEPPAGEGVLNCVFRLPSGARQPRRFLKTETCEVFVLFVKKDIVRLRTVD